MPGRPVRTEHQKNIARLKLDLIRYSYQQLVLINFSFWNLLMLLFDNTNHIASNACAATHETDHYRPSDLSSTSVSDHEIDGWQTRHTAYHEAAHAVIAHWFRWNVNHEGVRIIPDGYCGLTCRSDHYTLQAECCISLAGWLAEVRLAEDDSLHRSDDDLMYVLHNLDEEADSDDGMVLQALIAAYPGSNARRDYRILSPIRAGNSGPIVQAADLEIGSSRCKGIDQAGVLVR